MKLMINIRKYCNSFYNTDIDAKILKIVIIKTFTQFKKKIYTNLKIKNQVLLMMLINNNTPNIKANNNNAIVVFEK